MEKTDIYLSGDPSLSAPDERFKGIGSVYDLYEVFTHVWHRDTCAPRMRDKWSEDNRTKGQCSVTAFLVQDIYGGSVYGVPLGDGNYHCFNVIDENTFDLTCGQFMGEKLDYSLEHEQKREVHFKKEEKYQRYLLLKKRFTDYVSRDL